MPSQRRLPSTCPLTAPVAMTEGGFRDVVTVLR